MSLSRRHLLIACGVVFLLLLARQECPAQFEPRVPPAPAGDEDVGHTLRFPSDPSASSSDDDDRIRRLIRDELRKSKKDDDGKRTDEDESKSDETASKGSSPTEKKSKSSPLSLDDVWQNGFVAESADKQFRIHFGGRLEWDNGWFQQDPNLLIGPSSGPVQLQDGTDMRRARFRADGTVYEWIDFVTEVNFATIQEVSNVENTDVPVGSVGITDFYLTFKNIPIVGNLRAGHFKAPLSLERYTSANYLYYMERSPVFDAFFGTNQRQSGLMLFNSWLDDRVTLAASFTRVGKATLNSFAFTVGDGVYAGGVRATALPIYEDDGRLLLHFGANYFRQAFDQNQFAVANRFLIRAGGGSTQIPNIVGTGTFFTPDEGNLIDGEIAAVCGPCSFSAEYACALGTNVYDHYDGHTFSGPRGDIAYHAAYAEAGWFVTPGDYRRFDKKTATWARTLPQRNFILSKNSCGDTCRRGCGAIQLLSRLSYLDLVSGSPTLTPTSGGARAGIQKDLTLGINWYLNPQTIVSMNYVLTHVDSVVAGASGNIQGIGTRLHFDF